MTQFTKGPWKLNKYGNLISAVDGKDILLRGVTVMCSGNDDMMKVAGANMNLVAAAPELVEALEDMISRLKSALGLLKCDDEFIEKEVKKAQDALDLARGVPSTELPARVKREGVKSASKRYALMDEPCWGCGGWGCGGWGCAGFCIDEDF
ncbi:Ead/Ea22 domain-containing protein [Pseudomonas phage EM]|uniref:Ead/Ea22 domain-containing protein n=1 Tax=Pseudomonas phage EM TaxID=2936914 RepID=A0AAE9KST5_9CAUD|nr:Ead/Ea22 domain-containing protein [Pseudomonas phage EM]UPW35942.1 Ead/Ea22 domain-containing protein [Pseudomonas phage EM]